MLVHTFYKINFNTIAKKRCYGFQIKRCMNSTEERLAFGAIHCSFRDSDLDLILEERFNMARDFFNDADETTSAQEGLPDEEVTFAEVTMIANNTIPANLAEIFADFYQKNNGTFGLSDIVAEYYTRYDHVLNYEEFREGLDYLRLLYAWNMPEESYDFFDQLLLDCDDLHLYEDVYDGAHIELTTAPHVEKNYNKFIENFNTTPALAHKCNDKLKKAISKKGTTPAFSIQNSWAEYYNIICANSSQDFAPKHETWKTLSWIQKISYFCDKSREWKHPGSIKKHFLDTTIEKSFPLKVKSSSETLALTSEGPKIIGFSDMI